MNWEVYLHIWMVACVGLMRLQHSQLVNLWALHRAVFMRNGFESVHLGMVDGSWL